ncbi:protein kinase [bacterium]|nr:protein kinase [bacterium]
MDGKSLEKQNSDEDISADICAEPATVEAQELELPQMGDRFEILEILGSGGMGSVYRVKDRSIDEEYAVKILKAEIVADKQAVKRFELEVRAQESLSHPNLVPVLGQGHTLDGAPYMIMGLSEGVSLEAEIARGRKFSEDEVLSFVEQVAEALSHAHSKRVVHRDIKPGNILLEKDEDAGTERVKLVDFGIAKIDNKGASSADSTMTTSTGDFITRTGEFVGSPDYMSPEHCLGQNVDERSDIYSLGCVVNEIITGSPPFKSDSPVQAIVEHLNSDPVIDFSSQYPDSKRLKEMEKVVLKCLNKDPVNRYKNMEEFLADLRLIKSSGKLKTTRAGAYVPTKQKERVFGPATIVSICVLILVAPFLYQHLVEQFVRGYTGKIRFQSAGYFDLETEAIEDNVKIYELKDRFGRVVYSASASNTGSALRKALHDAIKFKIPLRDVVIQNADLSDMDLSGVSMPDARFIKTKMENVNFSGADLKGVRIIGCRADRTNFEDADFSAGQIQGTTFKMARFARAKMNHMMIDTSRFDRADLQKVSLLNTCFQNSNLNEAILDDAAIITNANFLALSSLERTRTSFISVQLKKTSFSGAKFANVLFKRCYFEDIILPANSSKQIELIDNRGEIKTGW